MTVKTIQLEELADAIEEEISDYTETITEGITTVSLEAAKECQQILKQTSPKQHGDYAKSWKVTPKRGRPGEPTKYIVHNEKHYRLTHLLEHGHAIKDSSGRIVGRAAPQRHITQAEEQAIEQFVKGIEAVIGGSF